MKIRECQQEIEDLQLQFSGEIHPVADLFPMMTDEELDDLAADIKANGLLNPIVLDATGCLIDGRNRYEGCRRAGVAARFASLNGHDPVAFILASNVARRHLSKGQQAMAVARARLLSGYSQRQAALKAGLSEIRVNQAASVLSHAPDLADRVLSGNLPLNEAYEEARRRKEAKDSEEVRFARLQATDPDLASMVQEGQLSLGEAIAEAAGRRARDEELRRQERERIERMTRRFDAVLTALDHSEEDRARWAEDWLNADPALVDGADFSAERARRSAEALLLYANLKEGQSNGAK